MPRKGPHRYEQAEYRKEMRRKRAIERLGIALDYDGLLTNRGAPKALGDFILQRWRDDDSRSSHEKVERLLGVLEAAPEVAAREIDAYLKAYDDAMQGLTHQERRALYFSSLGFQAKEVSRLDGVTEEAVKHRLTRARRKLHATTTANAVAIAIRKGLLWT